MPQTHHLPSDPRERLVRAGLLVLDELPLAKLYAGATSATVAERAGVTTGSFFHHFANAAEFADAMALSFAEPPADVGDEIEEMADALQHVGLLDIMHSSLERTWQIFQGSELMQLRFRQQMHLWSHHHQPLGTATAEFRTVGEVLSRAYRLRQGEATGIWSQLLERTGRKILPPFTLDRLATVLTSLFQGLVIRQAVDGGSVDDELFADTVTALAAALTVPLGSRIRLSDLTLPLVDDTHLSPQARSGARRRRETRARITAASSDLFQRGWESVSSSEIAERAGVSPQTVINLFPSVRAVAATTFARHLPVLREAATHTAAAGELGAGPGPLDRLERTLRQLAECVSADTEAARALLSERIEVVLRHGGELLEHDIRVEVPIALPVLEALEGVDLGDHEPIDVTRTLIDFTLGQAIGRANREAEVARLALRLLPDEALAGQRSADG